MKGDVHHGAPTLNMQASSDAAIAVLEARLGHAFAKRDLLHLALTRRGAARANNERLEYLGDAVLDLVVAEQLYRRFPQATESDLTIARSHLVRGSNLARLAADLGLGQFLRLADSERAAGTHKRQSALADAFEAVLGAVYLDAGLDCVRQLVLQVFGDALETVPLTHSKDAKSRLQEHLQGQARARPDYSVVAEEGPAHLRSFTVCARLADEPLAALGRAASRRAAEQRAARRLLLALGQEAGQDDALPAATENN